MVKLSHRLESHNQLLLELQAIRRSKVAVFWAVATPKDLGRGSEIVCTLSLSRSLIKEIDSQAIILQKLLIFRCILNSSVNAMWWRQHLFVFYARYHITSLQKKPSQGIFKDLSKATLQNSSPFRKTFKLDCCQVFFLLLVSWNIGHTFFKF